MDARYHIEHFDRNRHRTDNFHCGMPALDSYVKHSAGQESRKNVTVVYVLIERTSFDVTGYYTLNAASIEATDLPQPLTKKLPKYPALPAALIGRFAVDSRYQGKRLGEYLLMDALKRSYDVSKDIGTLAVIVQAKNDRVKQFYRRYGFQEAVSTSNLLFLPIATVAQLVEKNI